MPAPGILLFKLNYFIPGDKLLFKTPTNRSQKALMEMMW